MEKGLNHNTMYVRLFLLSFHNFHFIFSCGLQLNSCKVFFLWLVLASFIFFKNQVIVGKTLQFAKRYLKKKKKPNKQTNKDREVFPNSLLKWAKTILKNVDLSSVIQVVKKMQNTKLICQRNIVQFTD